MPTLPHSLDDLKEQQTQVPDRPWNRALVLLGATAYTVDGLRWPQLWRWVLVCDCNPLQELWSTERLQGLLLLYY
jgi:hypothetical protein